MFCFKLDKMIFSLLRRLNGRTSLENCERKKYWGDNFFSISTYHKATDLQQYGVLILSSAAKSWPELRMFWLERQRRISHISRVEFSCPNSSIFLLLVMLMTRSPLSLTLTCFLCPPSTAPPKQTESCICSTTFALRFLWFSLHPDTSTMLIRNTFKASFHPSTVWTTARSF